MPSPSNAFPQELVDEIIDAITDQDLLFSMSLVCKASRIRCQAKIFRKIRILDDEKLKGFQDILAKSPQIATYVHKVKVVVRARRIKALSEICRKLLYASRLTIWLSPIFRPRELESMDKLLTSLPSLSSLTMRTCTLSPAIFPAILNSCPNLQNLRFVGCVDQDDIPPLPPQQLIAPLGLHSISCEDSSRTVLDCLSKCNFCVGLPTHLSITHPSFPRNLDALLRLLDALKHSIAILEVMAEPFYWKNWSGSYLLLLEGPRLTHLYNGR